MTYWRAAMEDMINTVIELVEGGYVLSGDADGGDGGWTYAGITAKLADHYVLTKEDLMQSKETVINVYIGEFLSHNTPAYFVRAYATLQTVVFASAINIGNHAAAKCVQLMINCLLESTAEKTRLTVDGILGSNSADAFKIVAANYSIDELAGCFLHNVAQHYVDVVSNNAEKLQFLRGWMRRLTKLYVAVIAN